MYNLLVVMGLHVVTLWPCVTELEGEKRSRVWRLGSVISVTWVTFQLSDTNADGLNKCSLLLPAFSDRGANNNLWKCYNGLMANNIYPTVLQSSRPCLQQQHMACPALLPRLSWSCWSLTFLSHGHHYESLDLTGGFAQRTTHQGPGTSSC